MTQQERDDCLMNRLGFVLAELRGGPHPPVLDDLVTPMSHLLTRKPRTLEAIKALPGMTDQLFEAHGQYLLGSINAHFEQYGEDDPE